MRGYVKFYREMLDKELWLSEPFTRGQAWCDLVMLANYKDGYIRIAGQRIEVKRGQLGWSQDKLSKRWKWGRGKTRRFLKELEKDERICQKTNTRNTIITICNYDSFQVYDTTDGTTDDTTDGHQMIQQTDTNKKDKKKKEEEEYYISPSEDKSSSVDISSSKKIDLFGDEISEPEKPKKPTKRKSQVIDEPRLETGDDEILEVEIPASNVIDMFNSMLWIEVKERSKGIPLTIGRKEAVAKVKNDVGIVTERDWYEYFEKVRTSDFFLNRWKNWNIDWLLNSTNARKVWEGNYDE